MGVMNEDRLILYDGLIKTHITNTTVAKETGKGLSTNDYTTTEKNKLAGIADGANKTIVDDALSSTSTNPVQNKVIKAYVDKKASENVDFSTSTSKLLNDSIEAQLVLSNATRNLLNPTLATTTQNGVTCTNNGDGTYTLNGTATGGFATFIIGTINLIKGIKYAFCGCPKDGSDTKYRCSVWDIAECYGNTEIFEVDEDITKNVLIRIEEGITISNLIFKPMLTTDLSATYDDFVPYGGYEIQSCGKNLIDFLKIPFTCNTLATYTITNGILDISCNEMNNSGLFFPMNKIFNYFMRRKFKISFDAKASVGGIFNIGVEGIKMNLFDVGTEYERKVLEFEAVLKGPFDIYNMSGVSQHLYIKDFMIEIVDELDGIPTDYEPYTGETIKVTNDTESPAFGLKSHKGITHIISPGNVKCVYPTNESGVSVLEKERQLNDNKSDAVIDKSTGKKVVFTIENGIICAREA